MKKRMNEWMNGKKEWMMSGDTDEFDETVWNVYCFWMSIVFFKPDDVCDGGDGDDDDCRKNCRKIYTKIIASCFN